MKHWQILISSVALLTVTSSAAVPAVICTNPSEQQPRSVKGCLNFSAKICYIYRRILHNEGNELSSEIIEGQLKSNVENSTVDQCLYGEGRSLKIDANETYKTAEGNTDVFFSRPNQICLPMMLYNMSLHPPVFYLVVNSSRSGTAAIQLISKKSSPDLTKTIWYTSTNGLTITMDENITVDDSWMSDSFIEHQKRKTYLTFASASITSEHMRLQCMVQNFQRLLKLAKGSGTMNGESAWHSSGLDGSDTFILVLVVAVVVAIFFVGSLINAVMNYLTVVRLRKANISAVGGCSLWYLIFPALILRIVSQSEKWTSGLAEYQYVECDFVKHESIGQKQVAKSTSRNLYLPSVTSNDYDVPQF